VREKTIFVDLRPREYRNGRSVLYAEKYSNPKVKYSFNLLKYMVIVAVDKAKSVAVDSYSYCEHCSLGCEVEHLFRLKMSTDRHPYQLPFA